VMEEVLSVILLIFFLWMYFLICNKIKKFNFFTKYIKKNIKYIYMRIILRNYLRIKQIIWLSKDFRAGTT
jgi:hypothetical protein